MRKRPKTRRHPKRAERTGRLSVRQTDASQSGILSRGTAAPALCCSSAGTAALAAGVTSDFGAEFGGSAVLGLAFATGAGVGAAETGTASCAASSGFGATSRFAVSGAGSGFSGPGGLAKCSSRLASCLGRFSSSGFAAVRTGCIAVLGSPAFGSAAFGSPALGSPALGSLAGSGVLDFRLLLRGRFGAAGAKDVSG